MTSLLSFVMFHCVFLTFPCGILGQVRYLIVLIPDLYHLSYFACEKQKVQTSLCLRAFVIKIPKHVTCKVSMFYLFPVGEQAWLSNK